MDRGVSIVSNESFIWQNISKSLQFFSESCIYLLVKFAEGFYEVSRQLGVSENQTK